MHIITRRNRYDKSPTRKLGIFLTRNTKFYLHFTVRRDDAGTANQPSVQYLLQKLYVRCTYTCSYNTIDLNRITISRNKSLKRILFGGFCTPKTKKNTMYIVHIIHVIYTRHHVRSLESRKRFIVWCAR